MVRSDRRRAGGVAGIGKGATGSVCGKDGGSGAITGAAAFSVSGLDAGSALL